VPKWAFRGRFGERWVFFGSMSKRLYMYLIIKLLGPISAGIGSIGGDFSGEIVFIKRKRNRKRRWITG
jgi:hypothetical protein